MYVDDAVILSNIAAVLKQPDSATLITKGAFWPGSVAFHHALVYDDIVLALVRRGYLMEQIVAWDQGPTREQAITVYRCLDANKLLSQATADMIERAKQYEADLTSTDLLVAGLLIEPVGLPGQVSSGTLRGFENLERWSERCRDNRYWRRDDP
jgi:hypothetical protein